MQRQIYAVIFEQGTVKVGITIVNTGVRIADHTRYGDRFGVSVAKTLIWNVATNDLERRESALCGYCITAGAKRLPGCEWFMFKSPAEAEEVIQAAMRNIENNVFGEQVKESAFNVHIGVSRIEKIKKAFDMVRGGMDIYEAANKVQLNMAGVTNMRAYKNLMLELNSNKTPAA